MEKINFFSDLSEWVFDLNFSGKAIIVEGRRDFFALRKIGVKNEIYTLDGAIFEVVERVSFKHKEVVILTDMDKEGKKLYRRLNSDLQDHGVEVDNYFREFLQKTKLKQIEGIDNAFPLNF